MAFAIGKYVVISPDDGVYYRGKVIGETLDGIGLPKYEVQYHYRRINNKYANVYPFQLINDNIGDPIIASRNRRIVYMGPDDYVNRPANTHGIYNVFGPCPICGFYFADLDGHDHYRLWNEIRLDDQDVDQIMNVINDILANDPILEQQINQYVDTEAALNAHDYFLMATDQDAEANALDAFDILNDPNLNF